MLSTRRVYNYEVNERGGWTFTAEKSNENTEMPAVLAFFMRSETLTLHIKFSHDEKIIGQPLLFSSRVQFSNIKKNECKRKDQKKNYREAVIK